MAKAKRYYVIARGGLVKRQYYRWSDEKNDVIWQDSPFGPTEWTVKREAEAVAAHAGGRVVTRWHDEDSVAGI